MLVVIDERESVGLILVAIVLIRRDPVFYMRIILKLPMPAVSFIVRIICSQLIAQAQVEKDGIPPLDLRVKFRPAYVYGNIRLYWEISLRYSFLY